MPETRLSPDYRDLFTGMEVQAPLLDGSWKPYINLDNAASTPAMKSVREAVNTMLEVYSSVHRGSGFKSRVSTYAFEQSRRVIMKFVGADESEHVGIFGKNTTEACNKLARRFPFTSEKDTVLISSMEHHSNDLPWRAVANVVFIGMTPDGRLDEADFDTKLERYKNRLALVSVSGASNVTGYINPIYRLAEKTHAAGALIAVDCAQLAPHRAIHMGRLSDPAHLDFIMMSAHKMYAPYGTGILIGRKDIFNRGDPDLRGGGEVEIVTREEVHWSAAPDRDEAGSPNVLGAVAMAAAVQALEAIGMNQVAAHEAELTCRMLTGLNRIGGIEIYGSADPSTAANRLGVIPFNISGMSHYLTSAILAFEFGIGVRNGCFCAHPYLLDLMQVDPQVVRQVREQILSGDRSQVPGMVRISFGLFNTAEDVDACTEGIRSIKAGNYRGVYRQNLASGQYSPEGWKFDFSRYSPLKPI
jgi:selenocysteine lyase/cysteine desulfurase